jgi:hypothetical protein
MDEDNFLSTIVQEDWLRAARALTDPFVPDYWDDFRPRSVVEIESCEQSLQRRLPADFRDFLLWVGCGEFPRRLGGDLYCPGEIITNCPGPLWMLLGSTHWADDEQHRRLYVTRGEYNPAPSLFTEERLHHDGHSLFDLLQIGTDGCANYHQLYVGPEPRPFEYCLLMEDGTETNKHGTFASALFHIVQSHLRILSTTRLP